MKRHPVLAAYVAVLAAAAAFTIVSVTRSSAATEQWEAYAWQGTLTHETSGVKVQSSGSYAFSFEWESATFHATAGQPVSATVQIAAGSSSEVGRQVALTLRESTTGNCHVSCTATGKTESAKVTLSTTLQSLSVSYTPKTTGNHLDAYVYSPSTSTSDAMLAQGFTVTTSAQPVSITNAPCTVTLNAVAQDGSCSGTFTPKEAPKEETAAEREAREKTELEAKEKAEREQAEKETTTATVPSKPTGPTGEYHVVLADGFGAQLGTGAGQDNFWVPKGPKANGCCNNSNEIAAETPNKVRVGSGGLELLCVKETVEGKAFDCSGVDSTFNWKPGGGQTWAFQVVAQLPPDTYGGEDPGWWSTDSAWTDEIDFFEAWGWGSHAPEYYMGIPCWLPKAGGGGDTCHEIYKPGSEIPNPTGELHTYTTVVKPNEEAEEWIDGVHRWNLGPISGINTPWMHPILTHALREKSSLTASTFTIRSVSVYEIGTGNTEHGGIAPGTTVK